MTKHILSGLVYPGNRLGVPVWQITFALVLANAHFLLVSLQTAADFADFANRNLQLFLSLVFAGAVCGFLLERATRKPGFTARVGIRSLNLSVSSKAQWRFVSRFGWRQRLCLPVLQLGPVMLTVCAAITIGELTAPHDQSANAKLLWPWLALLALSEFVYLSFAAANLIRKKELDALGEAVWALDQESAAQSPIAVKSEAPKRRRRRKTSADTPEEMLSSEENAPADGFMQLEQAWLHEDVHRLRREMRARARYLRRELGSFTILQGPLEGEDTTSPIGAS